LGGIQDLSPPFLGFLHSSRHKKYIDRPSVCCKDTLDRLMVRLPSGLLALACSGSPQVLHARDI
jgi:hypothetical protein